MPKIFFDASVLDVANVVLQLSDKVALSRGRFPHMTIERLTFYTYLMQGYSFAYNGEKLFGQDFYSVRNGIVCEELVNAFGLDIKRIMNHNDVKAVKIEGTAGSLTRSQQDIVIMVMSSYEEMSLDELRKLVQDSEPWVKSRLTEDNLVKKSDIKSYYTKTLRDDIGTSAVMVGDELVLY